MLAGAEATWGRLDKQALEACLDVVALSLSVVMAGTGHLPTLKLLRGMSFASNNFTIYLPIRFIYLPSACLENQLEFILMCDNCQMAVQGHHDLTLR